jgi:hypothetical protein
MRAASITGDIGMVHGAGSSIIINGIMIGGTVMGVVTTTITMMITGVS